jgi:5-methylcytosine-specific restriction endonuclease McrA
MGLDVPKGRAAVRPTDPPLEPEARRLMTTPEKLAQVAATDATFTLRGANWVGKCLICNGPIAFDARTGEGATLEHIRARSRGGTDDLDNLGLVHARCNGEKGRRWDPKRRKRAPEYDAFIARLLERRRRRWRDAMAGGPDPSSRPRPAP